MTRTCMDCGERIAAPTLVYADLCAPCQGVAVSLMGDPQERITTLSGGAR